MMEYTPTSDEEHSAFDLMAAYLIDHVDTLHHEDFESTMAQSILSVMDETFESDQSVHAVERCLEFYKRYKGVRTADILWPTEGIDAALARLDAFNTTEQRTPAWYEMRHNSITASAAFKLFSTPAKFNELVYEKCCAVQQPMTFTGPRHWGVKYEPLTKQFYEHTYSSKVKEYGFILHPTYPFLGASPDGINVDPASPKYGCMVEIKNPTTRVITGVPKTDYFIQVQLQLEVCNLPYCDFIETHFTEYASYEDFEADGTFCRSLDGAPKGAFLLKEIDGTNTYLYPPFGCTAEEYAVWEEGLPGTWVLTLYWKLDDVSCVLIPRNERWFATALPVLQHAWETILLERTTGFDHRAPKKRTTESPRAPEPSSPHNSHNTPIGC
jgi:putative phage-type endonuclease